MKRKSKVVIVGPAYPYRGGQAVDEAYLFKTLTNNDFDCETITFTTLYPSFLFPGKTQYENSKNILFDHRNKIQRVIHSLNPLTWWKAYQIIKKQKPDAVIFIWWMPFFSLCYRTIIRLLQATKKKPKIIFLIDNYVSHEKRLIDKLLLKIAFVKVDALICQSQYIFSKVSTNYPNKQVYQTNLSVYGDFSLSQTLPSHARKTFNISKTAKVILFFGLIRPYKGLENLILSFPHVLKKYNDAILLIAGECYEDEKKYTSLIQNLKIKNNVIFHNKYIPNEDIEKYFVASDLVCMPYVSGTQSGIMMTALGYKKPVVVTNVGGIAELVVNNKTGIIVKKSHEIFISKGLIRAFETINFSQVEKDIEKVVQKIKDTKIDKIVTKVLAS